MTEQELQAACANLVHREVNCCLSRIVATLASAGADGIAGGAASGLGELVDQAYELAAPVDDCEEAAVQAGWEAYTDKFGVACWRTDETEPVTFAGTAQQLCENMDIEPYQWEVFEHWAVSTWLAEALTAQGEKVDTDFGGLNVWARTTTGQSISMDSCVRAIVEQMHKTKVEALVTMYGAGKPVEG